MHVFNQETLLQILDREEGVDIVSYGRPRDAFELTVNVPYWTSGYGSQYEMRHMNIPAGVMIAVDCKSLEALDLSDQEKLKEQLRVIDIYPTGTSGDFSGTDLKALRTWFTAHSRLDNKVNDQKPIAHAKELTSRGLGAARYNDLVEYLTDNMNIFKNPDVKGVLVPADRGQRKEIARALLEGLSKTMRYTRLDDPAKAYQIASQVLIEKGNDSAINLSMREPAKVLVVRTYKDTGRRDITPLDRSLIGKSYVTADGEPLGDRGSVDLSQIELKAAEIENKGRPTVPHPFLRVQRVEAHC